MCYSAECWALYDGYVKEFGADIDIKAFWQLYLGRDEKFRIRHKLIRVSRHYLNLQWQRKRYNYRWIMKCNLHSWM